MALYTASENRAVRNFTDDTGDWPRSNPTALLLPRGPYVNGNRQTQERTNRDLSQGFH